MKYSFLKVALPLFICSISACGGGGDGAELLSPRFTVTATAGEGGEITPASRQVETNATTSFTVNANPGYAIEAVTGCGGALLGDTYTTGPITGDCAVTASFTEATFFVGGNITGHQGPLQLTLQLANANETLVLGEDQASFTFTSPVRPGDTYEVSITSQPPGQSCQIANGFGELDPSGPARVEVNCVMAGSVVSVSGTIEPAVSIDTDSDINDVLAEFAANSTPAQAQEISNRVKLHGFASAIPTGGSPEHENFAEQSDPDDFFRVALQAGQRVQLQVVDFEGFGVGSAYAGDLDLYLYDSAGALAGFSDTTTEFEEILVPETRDYYVQVHAYSGISKYVLRLSPPVVEMAAEATVPLDFVPHEMVVKFKSTPSGIPGLSLKSQNVGRANLVALNRSARATASPLLTKVAGLDSHAVDKVETLREIKRVRLNSNVIYAEPNYIRQALRSPDDPGFQYQWHYQAIQLPLAWDISTGSSVSDDVIVAVIDTGVVLGHPDLAGQLVEGYDFIRDAERARDGDGIDPNADDPGDRDVRGQSSWHGTHVAGTVAAASNNGRGVAGVSWGAKIMPIRVLGSGGGTSYDIVQGLRYAAGLDNDSGTTPPRPADIANLSLGGPHGSLHEQEAYREARAAGMIIIAAAGNENTDAPSYPAAYDAVVSVAATDVRNQRAPYSNYGRTVAVAAPGGDMTMDANGDGYPDGVLSTLVDDTSGERTASYRFYHGTSMAAPHVAGVVALMKAVHPQMTPNEFHALLQNGNLTDDIGPPGRDPFHGYGLINAYKAVQIAQDMAAGGELPEPPPQVTASPTSLNVEFATAATITLTNEGGGRPAITDVRTEAEWLQVVATNTDEGGLGSYTVNINRAGLEDGLYQSAVVFTIDNAEELRVLVYMQVGASAPHAGLPPLYVLLLRSDTEEVVQVVPSQPAEDGVAHTYRFTNVPLGRYFIVAGSDIDVDYVICQSGEACGAYPTLANRQVVEVEGNDISELDFVTQILGGFPATSVGLFETLMRNPD